MARLRRRPFTLLDNNAVRALARNLAKDYPRSPRETLCGYVIAARTLDKCRASLAGTAGEYHFDCPLVTANTSGAVSEASHQAAQ